MEFIDTHCHIHSTDYGLAADAAIRVAVADGVDKIICVGENLEDSTLAVAFARQRRGCWASVGIHPHEAQKYVDNPAALNTLAGLATQPKVVAIGETGLDYFYAHSSKADQEKILRFQIELALKHNLPLIFHVREAFADFWPIFDEYQNLCGVIHSFSATQKELDEILQRGLYVGLNGIVTFTKDKAQLAAVQAVPMEKLLLETDAPFLTPTPYRGTINEPKHVRTVAEFLAQLRGESLEQLAAVITRNAQELFGLRK